MGLAKLTQAQRIEILEERNGRGSTLVTSQIPVDQWHEIIGDPTLGDAILDRLVHNAHRTYQENASALAIFVTSSE